jgi:hypothetical protein
MAQRDIDDMPRRQHDRLAGHAPVKLGKGDDRAGEGDRTDGRAKRHLDQADGLDRTDFADAEGLRRIKRGRGHKNGGQTHQAVESGDQLRHRRHRNALGNDRADATADTDAQ